MANRETKLDRKIHDSEEDIKAEILDYFDEQIVYLENQYQDEATKEELRKIKRFKKYMEKK